MLRFDPHATQFITFSQMSDFIGSLDPPLGIPKPNTLAIVSFDLPIAKVRLFRKYNPHDFSVIVADGKYCK